MLTGTVIRIGNMTVEDEKLHGISIECDKELLKNYKTNLLYRDVIILERLNGEIDITELDKSDKFQILDRLILWMTDELKQREIKKRGN